MTTRRSRAKVPSQAERLTRAETRRGKMAAARAAVKPGTRAKDARRGHARTMALPDLSELGLEGPIEDHAVPVVVAAELTSVSYQTLHQAILRGTLACYQYGGRRWVLLDDLVVSAPGRRQADQLANERHRLGWLDEHLTNGACTGARCAHWTHEGSVESQPLGEPIPTDDA